MASIPAMLSSANNIEINNLEQLTNDGGRDAGWWKAKIEGTMMMMTFLTFRKLIIGL